MTAYHYYFCVPCTTMWKHNTSSLWMNASDFIFWLLCIHNPSKFVILAPHCFPYMSFVDHVNKFVNYVKYLLIVLIFLLTMLTNLLNVPTYMMTVWIHLLIQLMPMIYQL
jgi:hypothetical protein